MKIAKISVFMFISFYVANSFAQDILMTNKHRMEEAERKEELARKIIVCNQSQTVNQEKYDVKYYDLYFDLDPQSEIIRGKVTMRAIALDELSMVELDFDNNMTVDSVFAAGSPTGFSNEDMFLLSINLDRAYAQGEEFEVRVMYNGSPRFGAFSFDRYNGKPMIWTLSQPFGARTWWPCKDVPADKADSVDIHVTVPNDLIVASNGTLMETIINGEKITYWWQEKYPMVTYLVSLAIHPYKVKYDNYLYNNDADTMKIHFYMFPDHHNELSPLNVLVKDMIACFADLFGEYPFVDEKYGHADFLGGGAMEHQTCTSFGFWNEWVFAHELAHQWWGDMITCDTWHHIWLNEGFATYCEALWFEYTYPQDTASRYQMTANLYLGPGTVYVEDPYREAIFHGGLSYNKGSWVLHMLRHVVSDSVFFDILKTYYASPLHQHGTATTEEFQAICEQVSGLDLSTFFHQWIYESGHPVYEYLWNAEPTGTGAFQVTGIINQTQDDGPIFSMPIDITIQNAESETTFVFMNDKSTQSFEYVVSDSPHTVLLDAGDWILKEVEMITKPVFQILSYEISDSLGNNDQVFEPGEEAALVITLANNGVSTRGVTAELTSDDPDITVLSAEASFGDIGSGSTNQNIATPFRIVAKDLAKSHVAHLTLMISTGDGYTTKLPVDVNLGRANILLVDDDGGATYELFWQLMAAAGGILVDTWEIATQGVMSMEDLSQYHVLVWLTGDDRTTTLTSEEQSLITEYLHTGGRLLLSGQDIGYDLVEDGSHSDSLFYTNYLHAQYVSDQIQEYMVYGTPIDPVGHANVIYFEGSFRGANNQNSPSIIEAIEPAVVCMNYLPSWEGAGVRYEDESTGYRVVYFAFGMEGAAGPLPNSGSALLAKAVDWLSGTSSVFESQLVNIPESFVLNQNFPNPFNPSTKTRFSLPQPSQVTVTIHNTLGQMVRVLHKGKLEADWHTIEWDGRNSDGLEVSSGVYLLRVRTVQPSGTEIVKTLKMAKLQ